MSDTQGKATGRKPGRKPSDDPTVVLSIRVPTSVADLLGPDPRATLRLLVDAEVERRRGVMSSPDEPA